MLQRLWAQTYSVKGFSLVELIIVIVILGILAMVAYPNFINLVENIKGTKAEQALRAGLKSEETHHIEFGRFIDSWEKLGLGIKSERYNYTALAPEPQKAAMLRAIPRDKKTTGYVAGIEVVITKRYGQDYKTAICEAKKPGIKPIEEAEVEFRKRRVVCDNKFRKVG